MLRAKVNDTLGGRETMWRYGSDKPVGAIKNRDDPYLVTDTFVEVVKYH